MNSIKHYGPGLTVLAASVLVMIGGPAAVRQVEYSRTEAQILQAGNRLKGTGILEELNQATRDIALMVEPSVVHISAESRGTNSRGQMGIFYGSTGSGWIYDGDGHIVTNAHVIDSASRVSVQLHTGELRKAEIVGMDIRTDIAVLKIDPGLLHPATRSDGAVQQGDMVFAFGSPYDFRFSMSSGLVSGLGRSAGIDEITYQNFIQVDAAINPGNSGGPLTDIHGEVIGMSTAIATGRGVIVGPDGQSAGVGLAIPVAMIESIVQQLIRTGEVTRGYLGVRLADLDQVAGGVRARERGFAGMGVGVYSVEPDGPAADSGLQAGDVVIAIDGENVQQASQLMSLIAGHAPGDLITLTIWRRDDLVGEAKNLEITVSLGTLHPETNASEAAAILQMMGLSDLVTSTRTLANEIKVPYQRGVMIRSVPSDSPLAGKVAAGSIITELMNQSVGTVDEFYTRLNRVVLPYRRYHSNESITMTVVDSQGQSQVIEIPLRSE